jgi:hypothetical protein
MVGNEVIDERSEGESSELIDPEGTDESKKQRVSARNGKMPDALLTGSVAAQQPFKVLTLGDCLQLAIN